MANHTTPTDTEIYTIKDVTALLGCDEDTASQRIITGDLPGTKFGRGWIVPRQAFIERLNEKAHAEAAERRAKLDDTREEAQRRGRETNQSSKPATPAVLQHTSAATKRGGRRTPPPLPTLSAASSI